MNNPYLFAGLTLAPISIQRIVAAVDPSRYDEKTAPNRFSLREAVAHLVDWEPILLQRMKTTIEAPGSTIQSIDEGERAVEMRYDKTDPLQQASMYVELRGDTLQFLRAQAEGHWDSTVRHSERGIQTLADQVVAMLGHDHYHIEHLTQYLDEKGRI